jgi:indole-3-glycerol phosphate synthase
MLSRSQISQLLDAAAEHGMFVLLEAFDAADLATAKELLTSRSAERATAGGATATAGRTTGASGRATDAAADLLVGVNCRDLATLEVVQERFEALAPQLPGDWPAVAESGVATAADARRMRRLGYRLALIGTALMGCDEPAKLLGEILAATRTLQS